MTKRTWALPDNLYLVVSTDIEIDPSALGEVWQCLSPRLMQWEENIWMIDLEPTVSYWRHQAEKKACSLEQILQQVLEQLLPEANTKVVIADHPWRGLLLLKRMIAKGLSGMMNLPSPIPQHLYRQVSWAIWWESARLIADHFEARKDPHFRRETYRQSVVKMVRGITRLRLDRPWQMRFIKGDKIKRRYGVILQALWSWTFHGEQVGVSFPWMPWYPKSYPKVDRNLDHSALEWGHIASYMREDFDRLCESPEWRSQDKVVGLEWCVTLTDMSCLVIPICFRHPHSLHQEANHQSTALLQSQFAFEREVQGREVVPDLSPLGVVRWELAVTEIFSWPRKLTTLFGDFRKRWIDHFRK